MDAFAVSIGLGAKHAINRKKLAFMAAIYFGLFQGLMPIFGYFAGKGVAGWVEEYASWVAFALLLMIGGKMVYESFSEGVEKDIKNVTHRIILVLAIATSIDALAAGFALAVLKVNPLISCLVIALTTCVLSYAGVFIGAKSGTKLENKAELFGGVVLILIGFKMLLF